MKIIKTILFISAILIALPSYAQVEAGAREELESAALNGDITMVSSMINDHPELGEAVFFWALYKENPKIVESLLLAGINPNMFMESNVKGQGLSALQYMIISKYENAWNNRPHQPGKALEIIKLLLKHGADADEALPVAMKTNDDDVIQDLLIEAGRDPNLKLQDKVTKLMLSVWEHNYDNVAMLLKNGANPDTQDNNGNTALMFASTYCFDEDDRYILILSELLKYKAGPDIQNKKGETALMMAAARPAVPIPSCRYKTVEELLKYNADTKIKDNKGQTALSSLKKLIKKLEAPGFGDYYKKSAEEAKKIAYLLVGKPPKTKGKDKKVGENEIAYIEQIKKDLLTLTL